MFTVCHVNRAVHWNMERRRRLLHPPLLLTPNELLAALAIY